MSDNTKISWSDASWNPVSGCTEVSPGCAHCYAKTFAERWRGVPGNYYENGFDVQLRPNMLERPLRWKKPRRIFVNSMSDLFHEDVPDWYIDKCFAVMENANHHTFQVLTKRIERAIDYLSRPTELRIACIEAARNDLGLKHPTVSFWPLRNVLIGPTIENQHFADVRLPVLAQLHEMGWRTMVSYEPALGPVNFVPWLGYCDHIDLDGTDEAHVWRCNGCGVLRRDVEVAEGEPSDAWVLDVIGPRREYQIRYEYLTPEPKRVIDWLICGGESGDGRRPFNHAWARSALQQCRDAGIPFFMKQDGSFRSEVYDTLPDDLKVREFPR